MTRVLVIGREGQLARELARARWPAGWSVTCAGRPELDLRFPDKAAAFVTAAAPDIVVNAAAYTNVEQAESEYDVALAINATGPAAVAAACASIGAPFLTVSTDYVFDGKKQGAYVEDDPIAPIGAYGRSKAEGEPFIRNALPDHLILRTSWVFSPFGNNFVKTMMRLGGERPVLRIVADQHGCPTHAGDLARAIVMICEAAQSGKGRFGTYHVANAGLTTWHEMATAIFDAVAARGGKVPDQVVPITTAEFPTKAARPANSVLDCSRLASTFGVTLRPWRDAVDDCVGELMKQKQSA
ncbi:MAG TPA: dTDP-4-dehydrorhamnose reductase [Bradyrhizobium sp.]|nr:dTDP-4-dehydrorhamnose reductase [Bradyrhizobium sp.]